MHPSFPGTVQIYTYYRGTHFNTTLFTHKSLNFGSKLYGNTTCEVRNNYLQLLERLSYEKA